jgi:hypothetical protein
MVYGGTGWKAKLSKRKTPSRVIGWREWVALPELGIPAIKAKIDTGARSSALHAYDLHFFTRQGKPMVRFKVHRLQRDTGHEVESVAALVEQREVKNSGGQTTVRPVILTTLEMMGETWAIELTLVRRDDMGFRMLLGRQAVRGRFVIDAGRSFYNGKPPMALRRRRKR